MFNFKPKWKFDFKVNILRHVETLEQGKQISIPVRLDLLRGKPQQVDLDINTNWESVGLTAQIIPSKLDPSQPWTATMTIRASVNTPPNSYLFTVRGGTKGTFGTSEDAVTVIVEPKDKQRSDEKDSPQFEQSGNKGDPSFDLDKLFTSKNEGQIPVIENGGIKNPNGNSSAGWWVFAVIMGIVILFIILATSGVFDGGGACPASAPIDCGGGCCPAGDGGRTDVCCPGNKCTSNGKCGSSTPVNPGGCPPLDCGERGLGGAVPKQCPCPPGCPYESVTSSGYKQCSSF